MHLAALFHNLFCPFLVQHKRESELQLHILRVCVCNKNRFGKKSFLGEVQLPLSALDLTNSTKHWYSLEEKVHMTNNQYTKFLSNNEE